MNKIDSLYKEMEKRIVYHRKILNLSQEKLAKLANMSVKTLSAAERGTQATTLDDLIKISKALEVSIDYLLTGEILPEDLGHIANKMKSLSIEQIDLIEKNIDRFIEALETPVHAENMNGDISM